MGGLIAYKNIIYNYFMSKLLAADLNADLLAAIRSLEQEANELFEWIYMTFSYFIVWRKLLISLFYNKSCLFFFFT